MDEKKGITKADAVSYGGQAVMFLLSVLKLFAPNILKAGEEVALNILNAFDAKLIPWVFVLNIMGYWLKKLTLPKWFPPMPVVILAASFVVCTTFGWCYTPNMEGARLMVVSILEYGIGNGAIVALLSCYGYDTVHSITKKLGTSKTVEVKKK